jgi:hypothetical protein
MPLLSFKRKEEKFDDWLLTLIEVFSTAAYVSELGPPKMLHFFEQKLPVIRRLRKNNFP